MTIRCTNASRMWSIKRVKTSTERFKKQHDRRIEEAKMKVLGQVQDINYMTTKQIMK